MNYGAFGLVEVVGSSNAILVIDQMLKTSDVSFLTWQTKCGGHATVFLTGDVSAIEYALSQVTRTLGEMMRFTTCPITRT